MPRLLKRHISLPLGILLAVAFVHGLAWSIATAPLEGPDEIAHAAYAQHFAETGHAPSRSEGNSATSTGMTTLTRDLNLELIQHNSAARPFWGKIAEISKVADAADQANGEGPNAAGIYPPLYYATAAVAYRLSPDTSLLGRLWAMRFVGVLMFVGIVWLSWLVAAQLFDPTWQRTLATAVVALQPKLGMIAGVINPDIMLIGISVAVLLVALRIGIEGLTWKRALTIGALAGAGAFCHARGYFLPPFAIFAIAVGWLRHRVTWRSATPLLAATTAISGLGVMAATLFTRAHGAGSAYGSATPTGGLNAREFISFVWQFYLPKLSSMSPRPGPYYGYRQVFVESFWGQFASLDVYYPLWVYDAIQVSLGVLGLALLLLIARRFERLWARWPAPVLMAGFTAALLGLLHLVSYSTLRGSTDLTKDAVITGRYLLPLLPILACLVAWLVGAFPAKLRPLAAGGLVAVLAVLAISGIGLTMERFYA